MRKRTARNRSLVLLYAVLVAVAIGGCDSKRREILCDVNHPAVLSASREILNLVAAGGLKPGRYEVQWKPTSPEASKFPKAILDLKPAYVFIDGNGYLMVEMHAGFDHFGFFAYPRDFNEPYPDFIYGDFELIDGLWYYDDDYRDDRPRYKKKIDKWMEDCRSKPRLGSWRQPRIKL